MAGVCVLTSSDAFMAKETLFEKLGFTTVDQTRVYKLLCLDFGISKAKKPSIIDNSAQLKSMKGWHVLYSKQCPWG